MCVCVCGNVGRKAEALVPALVTGGQASLLATKEAVLRALLLDASGRLDWR